MIKLKHLLEKFGKFKIVIFIVIFLVIVAAIYFFVYKMIDRNLLESDYSNNESDSSASDTKNEPTIIPEINNQHLNIFFIKFGPGTWIKGGDLFVYDTSKKTESAMTSNETFEYLSGSVKNNELLLSRGNVPSETILFNALTKKEKTLIKMGVSLDNIPSNVHWVSEDEFIFTTGLEATDLYKVNVNNANLEKISKQPEECGIIESSLNPSKTKLAYVSDCGETPYGYLGILDIKTGESKHLLENNGDYILRRHPGWVSDEDIVFLGDKGFWLMDINGRELEKFLDTNMNPDSFYWDNQKALIFADPNFYILDTVNKTINKIFDSGLIAKAINRSVSPYRQFNILCFSNKLSKFVAYYWNSDYENNTIVGDIKTGKLELLPIYLSGESVCSEVK